MSELKLKGFAERAEERMPLPDFTALSDRGRELRHRRQAAVAGVLACVLAVAGILVVRNDSPKAVEPVRPPDNTPVRGPEYPGPVMEDLEAGTYELTPSPDPVYPRASITLPEGWNAWEGPNRFDVNEPAAGNEEALEEITWYVGILVVEVYGVQTRPCSGSSENVETVEPTAESLVRAIRQVRGGFRMTETPEPLATFGYPATRFRLTPTDGATGCEDNLFITAANGVVGGYADIEDVWVVDVDGYPVLIDSQLSGEVPPAVQGELEAAVDSIEFHFEE